MVAIAREWKKLVAPFNATPEAAEVIRSAMNVARLILQAQDVSLEHKKKIIDQVLWYLTEAEGKYKTRFRSKKVVDLANLDHSSQETIQHEHVFTKKYVIAKIINNIDHYNSDGGALNLLLDESVGCIVTKEEHRMLLKNVEGWGRYINVPVYDMSFVPPRLQVIYPS